VFYLVGVSAPCSALTVVWVTGMAQLVTECYSFLKVFPGTSGGRKTMELAKPGSPGKWPLNGDGGKCCCTRKNHNENQLQSLHFFKITC